MDNTPDTPKTNETAALPPRKPSRGSSSQNPRWLAGLGAILSLVALALSIWLALELQALKKAAGQRQSQQQQAWQQSLGVLKKQNQASISQALQQAQSRMTAQSQKLQSMLSQTEQHLNDIKQDYTQNKNNLNAQMAQAMDHGKQALTAQLQAQAARIQTNQSKLNKLLQSSGHQQYDWVITESEYLMRMAQLNLVVNGDTQQALTLSYMADARLQSLKDPSLSAVRQALARDQQALRAVPPLNMEKNIQTMDGISTQIGQLPINPNMSRLKKKHTQKIKPSGSHIKDQWNRSINELKSLFVIRKLNQPIRPLLSPDDLVYVQTNIQLKMSQAEWAMLHRQESVYQHSLTSASQWIKNYFNQDGPQTQKLLQAIQRLQQINVAPTLPDLSKTINMIRLSHHNSSPHTKPATNTTANASTPPSTAMPPSQAQHTGPARIPSKNKASAHSKALSMRLLPQAASSHAKEH